MLYFNKSKFFLLFSLAAATKMASAQQNNNLSSNRNTPEESVCASAGSACISCLNSGCVRTGKACVPACDPQKDAQCYSPRHFVGWSVNAICMEEEANDLDSQICGAQNDCQQCTSQLKALGQSTCSWYADESHKNNGWCGIGGRPVNGVAPSSDASTCSAPRNAGNSQAIVNIQANPAPRNTGNSQATANIQTKAVRAADSEIFPSESSSKNAPSAAPSDVSWDIQTKSLRAANGEIFDSEVSSKNAPSAAPSEVFLRNSPGAATCAEMGSNCISCLNSGCTFEENTCVSTACDRAAGGLCYSEATNPGWTVNAVCKLAEKEAIDAKICSQPKNCQQCTSQFTAFGLETCTWYADGSNGNGGWCGIGKPVMGNFGTSDSNKCPAPTKQGAGGFLRGGRPGTISWP